MKKKANATNLVHKNWALFLGIITSVAAALIHFPASNLLLLLFGAIAGLMIVPEREEHYFIVFALGLWAGLSSLSSLTIISPNLMFVETIGKNLAMLASSGALVVSLRALAYMAGFFPGKK